MMEWLETKEYIPPCGVWCLTFSNEGDCHKLMLKTSKKNGSLSWYGIEGEPIDIDIWCKYEDITHFCVIKPPLHAGKINIDYRVHWPTEKQEDAEKKYVGDNDTRYG